MSNLDIYFLYIYIFFWGGGAGGLTRKKELSGIMQVKKVYAEPCSVPIYSFPWACPDHPPPYPFLTQHRPLLASQKSLTARQLLKRTSSSRRQVPFSLRHDDALIIFDVIVVPGPCLSRRRAAYSLCTPGQRPYIIEQCTPIHSLCNPYLGCTYPC